MAKASPTYIWNMHGWYPRTLIEIGMPIGTVWIVNPAADNEWQRQATHRSSQQRWPRARR